MIVRSIWEGGRDIVCIHVPVLVINQNMISFVSSPEEELHCWGGGVLCLYINLRMVIWIQIIFFSPGAGLQPWGGGAPEVHQGSGPNPQLHDKEDPGDPQKGGCGVHGMSRRSGQCSSNLECFIIEVFLIANIWKEYSG